MRFGVDLYPIISADLTGPVAFEYALRMVRAARDGGFDGVFASHHYATGARERMFQPLPLLARMAAEAPGMTFGTAVYLLSLNRPLDVAEQTATLDIITGGKLVFGVGQGYRDVEFESLGVPKRERSRRMEEAVRVLRKLWSEDDVDWDGEFFHLRGVTINPKPVQQPGPPVWAGADTLPGVARVAGVADRWLTSPRHSKTFIREALGTYRDRRAELGLPAEPPVFFREMYVAPTREDAEREIQDAFERLYQTYHRWGQPGERYDRRFQELKEERIIVGDPDDVAREIARYREEFDAGYMFFRLYFPGMDPEKSVRCIQLFGREVLPRLAD